MNGYQRIRAALAGQAPDRVPVMLHNFLMAAREAGHSQRRFRENPAAIAGSFIQAVETYGYDGVLVDVDTVTVAEALGVRVDHPEDQPARWAGPRIASLAEVRDLPPPDIESHPRVLIWLEAVRRLKDYFRDEVYVRGNCDQAGFSLASMMRGVVEYGTGQTVRALGRPVAAKTGTAQEHRDAWFVLRDVEGKAELDREIFLDQARSIQRLILLMVDG